MSAFKDLAYDIEQMYIEGFSPKTISVILECDIDTVYQWLNQNSVEAEEEYAE